MSHASGRHDACLTTILFPWFHFETHSVAHGVTDTGVGSGALLGDWELHRTRDESPPAERPNNAAARRRRSCRHQTRGVEFRRASFHQVESRTIVRTTSSHNALDGRISCKIRGPPTHPLGHFRDFCGPNPATSRPHVLSDPRPATASPKFCPTSKMSHASGRHDACRITIFIRWLHSKLRR